jgi:hypothetical protein
VADYYRAQVRFGRGWFILEGRSAWIEHYFRHDPIGEHARWWLKMERRHATRWRWWQLRPPSPPFSFRIEDPPRLHEEIAAWAITAVAVWKALGR